MRYCLISAFASIFIMTAAVNAHAIPRASLSTDPTVQLVQEKRDETLKQKVKRIWREWTGYKFDVACPVFPIPLTHSTCTVTAKNRDEARAKCQAQNQFCSVTEAKR